MQTKGVNVENKMCTGVKLLKLCGYTWFTQFWVFFSFYSLVVLQFRVDQLILNSLRQFKAA